MYRLSPGIIIKELLNCHNDTTQAIHWNLSIFLK